MRTPPAIGFEYRVSAGLVAATVLVAALAVVAAWTNGLSHGWRAVMFALVLVLAVHAVTRLLRPRVKSLLWRLDGGVDVHLHDTVLESGRAVQGTVRGARVMGPLVVLLLQWPPRERAALWLLPDNLDADTRRRLRMRLGASRPDRASGNADSR